MSIKKIIYSILILSFFASCKGTKKLGGDSKKMDADKVRLALIQNQVRADWFSANSKISVNGGGMSQSASATIRMKKDSVIWISVKKIGFEIARAMITSDSVYVIDRFNQQYIADDLAFLSETYNLPASLATLQSVLIGNPVFFTVTDLELEETEEEYKLQSIGIRKGSYWLDKEQMLMRQMLLEDAASEQALQIQLKDYQQLPDNQFFSYLRELALDSKDTGDMRFKLEYQKVEIDQPKSIRFEIPKNYKKAE